MNIFKVNGSFNAQKLLSSLLLTFGAGVLGGFFSNNAAMIYLNLYLPSFAPPAGLFGPVWMLLYFLMGLAFYRVWMAGTNNPFVKSSMVYFVIQLIFNVLWSAFFFAYSLPLIAFIDIILLIILILITTAKFFKIDRAAGILMLPYLAWTIFTAALNLSILMLNF